jgi:hypothetical protein
MDYLMPYDSDTGDVWDSEQIVDGGYDMTADVEYLLNNFKEYADQRNSEWDEFADDLYGVRESKKRPLKKSMKEVYVSDSDEGYIEVWDVNENEISAEVCDAIGEAVGYIDSGDGYPTWKWEIGSGDGGTYYLVLGFAPGFDPNADEYTDSYGSHLALKWGILSKNSAMAEYDMDFEMPYDPETGDVWDSEQAIYSDSPNIVASDVKDVLNNFYEYAKQVNTTVDVDFDEDDIEYESIRLKRESTNKRRPTSKRKRNK